MEMDCVPLISDMGSTSNFAKDIKFIKSKDYSSLLVRRIDHTKYSSDKVKELSLRSVSTFESSVAYLFAVGFQGDLVLWTPDMRILDRHFVYQDRVKRQLVEIRRAVCSPDLPKGKYLFCAPESSYEYFKDKLSDISSLEFVLVKNDTLGGSTVVGGLLTFSDIALALSGVDVSKYQGFFVTSEMISKQYPGCDMLGVTIENITEQVGIHCLPIGLVRNLHDTLE